MRCTHALAVGVTVLGLLFATALVSLAAQAAPASEYEVKALLLRKLVN